MNSIPFRITQVTPPTLVSVRIWIDGEGESFVEAKLAELDGFWRASATLEPNASDFFAISKNAADVLRKNYRGKVRFLSGYVQNIGFRKTTITYAARPRVAGQSKYSIRKLVRFSINTILCFSDLPLKLGVYSGLFVGFLGLLLMIYTIWSRVRTGTPSGYATIVVALCFMFAMLFVVVGIIGEYISILFTELKDRPIYIVRRVVNREDGKKSEATQERE